MKKIAFYFSFLVVFGVSMSIADPYTYQQTKDLVRERFLREGVQLSSDAVTLIDEMAYQKERERGEGQLTWQDLTEIYQQIREMGVVPMPTRPTPPRPAGPIARPTPAAAAAPAAPMPPRPTSRLAPARAPLFTYAEAIDRLYGRFIDEKGVPTEAQKHSIIEAVENLRVQKGLKKNERGITSDDINRVFDILFAPLPTRPTPPRLARPIARPTPAAAAAAAPPRPMPPRILPGAIRVFPPMPAPMPTRPAARPTLRPVVPPRPAPTPARFVPPAAAAAAAAAWEPAPAVVDYSRYTQVVKETLDENDRMFQILHSQVLEPKKLERLKSLITSMWAEYDYFGRKWPDRRPKEVINALWCVCPNAPEHMRIIFLAELVDHILLKYPPSSHDYVTITDFGGGEGFVDYLLAVELKKKYKEIYVNLIDTVYPKHPPLILEHSRFGNLVDVTVQTFPHRSDFLWRTDIAKRQGPSGKLWKPFISHVFIMVDSTGCATSRPIEEITRPDDLGSHNSFAILRSREPYDEQIIIKKSTGSDERKFRILFNKNVRGDLIDRVQREWSEHFNRGGDVRVFIFNLLKTVTRDPGFLRLVRSAAEMHLPFFELIAEAMVPGEPALAYELNYERHKSILKYEMQHDPEEAFDAYDQKMIGEGYRVFKVSRDGSLLVEVRLRR